MVGNHRSWETEYLVLLYLQAPKYEERTMYNSINFKRKKRNHGSRIRRSLHSFVREGGKKNRSSVSFTRPRRQKKKEKGKREYNSDRRPPTRVSFAQKEEKRGATSNKPCLRRKKEKEASAGLSAIIKRKGRKEKKSGGVVGVRTIPQGGRSKESPRPCRLTNYPPGNHAREKEGTGNHSSLAGPEEERKEISPSESTRFGRT